MIVIVSGSRHTPDELTDQCLAESKLWEAATFVLAGACIGPDKRAVHLAKLRKLPFEEIQAGWDDVPPKQRAQQGPIRNSKLLGRAVELARAQNLPIACIGLWDGVSDGTADMLRKARGNKTPPIIVEMIRVPIQAQAVRRKTQGTLFDHLTDEGRTAPRQAPYRAPTPKTAPNPRALDADLAVKLLEAGAPYLPDAVGQ